MRNGYVTLRDIRRFMAGYLESLKFRGTFGVSLQLGSFEHLGFLYFWELPLEAASSASLLRWAEESVQFLKVSCCADACTS